MKILAFTDCGGQISKLEKLNEIIQNEDIRNLLFLGNIVEGNERRKEWSSSCLEHRLPISSKPDIIKNIPEEIKQIINFFAVMGKMNAPLYFVPGYKDAPESRFFVEAIEMMGTYSNLFMAQENMFVFGHEYLISGFGGQITENFKETEFTIKYPAEHILFALRKIQFFPYKKILLIPTPPKMPPWEDNKYASKAVNDVIFTYKPEYLFISAPDSNTVRTKIEETDVINVPSFKDGNVLIFDFKNNSEKIIKI